MPTISLIVAASANQVIGSDGALPWRLPDDLERFKTITMGKPIVMGRKTWESIGRALPGRHNIVLTRNSDFVAEACTIAASADEALAAAGDVDEVMIIGGGQIYEMFLPRADRVYLTRVHADIDGDTRFPDLPDSEWQLVKREARPADERNEFPFAFEVYDRRD